MTLTPPSKNEVLTWPHVKDLVHSRLLTFFKTQKTPDFIQDQCFYAMGGKYVRSYLSYLSCRFFYVEDMDWISAAAAVELIHSYSLIHDDLPCMDNASLRRHQPSFWKKYGEQNAVLMGDALLTEAFNLLSHANLYPIQLLNLIRVLSKMAGLKGMVQGQYLDLQSKTPTQADRLKTGGLFAYCLSVGPILADQDYKPFYDLGLELGEVYQLIDDKLDKQGKEIKTGKSVKKDDGKLKVIDLLSLTEYQDLIDEKKDRILTTLRQKTPDFDPVFDDFLEGLLDRKG